jgi:hypothetical protein
MHHTKRGRGLGDLGSSTYDQSISSGLITRTLDAIHYDTNILVTTDVDKGVTSDGEHGRFAKFRESRLTPLLGDTKDYTVSLVRGSITTNNIPLFCPKPSKIVTEGGKQMWELAAQPGLNMTWTGPVYTTAPNASDHGTTGVPPYMDRNSASWPQDGFIPWYTSTTLPAVGTPRNIRGCLNCAYGYKAGPDIHVTNFASRLTAMFVSNLNGGNSDLAAITVSVSGTNTAAMTQVLGFANASTTQTVYLDFTLPARAFPFANSTGDIFYPTNRGILQACKFLGFLPNTVFAIPPGGTVVYAPRAFQLGFRATMNLFSYKNVRWVPEDQAALIYPMPTVDDVTLGTMGRSPTYFDCYSYNHFLEKCINPTFQRLIYDEFDFANATSIPLDELSLQLQLYGFCNANCSAFVTWDSTKSYVKTESVCLNGRAYYALSANKGINPASTSLVWQDCGQSICSSWVPGNAYTNGDLVTYPVYYAAGYYNATLFECTGTTSGITGPPDEGGAWTNWASRSVIGQLLGTDSVSINANQPTIGTAAPVISFNSSTQLFVLNLDSYGYGGTASTNVDDGYNGFPDDQSVTTATTLTQVMNGALNDQARDSWGITGTGSMTTPPYIVARHPFTSYDEKFNVECDDYFHQLFGNWPSLKLLYTDPRTQTTSSYVRYFPQVSNAGLAVTTPLPLVTPTVATTSYLPYGRISGNTPYIYTYPQDYTSVGLMWNPVDTIVVIAGEIPLLDDQVSSPFILGDVIMSKSPPGKTLKILGEFVVRDPLSKGQQYRSEVIFEPSEAIHVSMQGSVPFIVFDYAVCMRMKNSGALRVMSISNGGSVFMRFEFQVKR